MQTTPFEIGDLQLIRGFYPEGICADYLKQLQEFVDWSDDYYLAFGRRIPIPRLQAWYADEGIRYSYSNNLLETQPWIEPLITIRQDIEQAIRKKFNAVLLTYYRNGDDSVSWHADDEIELGPQPSIASLSLGATRQLHFRHREVEREDAVTLHSGDLLIMQPHFQKYWEHCVPEEPYVTNPRINLTFRRVTG